MLAGRRSTYLLAFHKADGWHRDGLTGYGIGRIERNPPPKRLSSGIATVLDQCHAMEVRGVEYGKQPNRWEALKYWCPVHVHYALGKLHIPVCGCRRHSRCWWLLPEEVAGCGGVCTAHHMRHVCQRPCSSTNVRSGRPIKRGL